ncbi:MAG: AAA family ATPase [Thermoplasmata archaeon]
MLNSIRIERLRGFNTIEINNFRKVNVVAGRNGCGKSTLLDACFWICGPLNPDISLRLNLFRKLETIDPAESWKTLFYNFDTTLPIFIEGTFENNKEKRTLEITTEQPVSSGVDKEKENTERIIDIPLTNQKDILGKKLLVTELYTKFTIKRTHDNPRIYTAKLIKEPQLLRYETKTKYTESIKGMYLNQNTMFQDLPFSLTLLQTNKQLSKLIKPLQKIFPMLTDLRVGIDNIVYCDVGLPALAPINILGDGIHRFLSVIAAITNTPNGIVLIDEIENGFHYETLRILWPTLFDACIESNVQVFITTHSIECLTQLAKFLAGKENNKLYENNFCFFRIEQRENKTECVEYDYATFISGIANGWEVR